MLTRIPVVRLLVSQWTRLFAGKSALSQALNVFCALVFSSSLGHAELSPQEVFSGASTVTSIEDWSTTDKEILAAMNQAQRLGIPFNFYGQDFSPQTLIDLYIPKVHLLTDQAKLISPNQELDSDNLKFFFAAHQVFDSLLGFPRVSLQDLRGSQRQETKERLVRVLTKRMALLATLAERYDLDWFSSWSARNGFELNSSTNASSTELYKNRNSSRLFELALEASKGNTKKSRGIIKKFVASPIIQAGLPSSLKISNADDLSEKGLDIADQTSIDAVAEMNQVMTPRSSYTTYEDLAVDLAELIMDSDFVNLSEQLGLGSSLSAYERSLEEKIAKVENNEFPFDLDMNATDLEFKRQRLIQKYQRLAFKVYQLQKNGNQELDSSLLIAKLRDHVNALRDVEATEDNLNLFEEKLEADTKIILANRHTNSNIPDSYLQQERSFIKPSEAREEKALQALRLADIDWTNKTHRDRLTAFGYDWSDASIQLDAELDNGNSNALSVIEAPEELDYIQRLISLRDAVYNKITYTFLPHVENSNLPEKTKASIRKTLNEFLENFNQKVQQSITQYRNEFFGDGKPTPKNGKAKAHKIADLESHMVRSLNQSFRSMIEISTGINKGKARFKSQIARIERTIKDLKTGSSVYVPIVADIMDQFPMKARLFAKMCTYISRLCIKNQNLTDFIRNRLTFADVSHSGKPVNFTGIDVETIKQALPEDAVVIVVANHDYAPLDAKVLDELARQLGSEETMFLTTKLAYPHFFLRKNRDPNTFFIQDRTWMTKSIRRMRTTKGRTIFNIFPEGTLPFWLAQFPLTAKAGGFVVARRAAHKLAGKKPVYMLEVQTNILPYMLNNEKDDLQAELLAPVLVPTHEVDRNDEWVRQMRINFESRTNYHRGESSPVIVDAKQLEGSRLWESGPLVKFVSGASAAQPFGNHIEGRTQDMGVNADNSGIESPAIFGQLPLAGSRCELFFKSKQEWQGSY